MYKKAVTHNYTGCLKITKRSHSPNFRMKLCPLHTDRWESAPPDTSNTGVVITVTVITTPVLRLTMLQIRQKNPKIVKRMNSYFEGIKNMWMAKLSLFSPLPFSFSTLVIGSITF